MYNLVYLNNKNCKDGFENFSFRIPSTELIIIYKIEDFIDNKNCKTWFDFLKENRIQVTLIFIIIDIVDYNKN